MTTSFRPDPEKRARAARRRTLGVWGRRVLLLVGAAGVTAAIVAAWWPRAVPVDLAALQVGPMRVTIDETGRSRVREKYVVSAPLAGTLARIELRPGDTVTAQQVLAMLVPISSPLLDPRSRAEANAAELAAGAARRQAEANVARAKLALSFARDELKRQESLVAAGAIPAVELDHARMEERSRAEELASTRFGAQVAAHQLEQARAAASHVRDRRPDKGEYMEVRSPTAGRVLRVLQESAGPVAAGAPLVEIGDPTRQEIVVDVLTPDAVAIASGAHVSIERWGGEKPLTAHVRAVEPSAFTRVSALGVEEQRVNVMIDLDEPYETWAAMGDGYRLDAHIVVWEAKETLRAPSGALFRRGDGWAAYVVQGQTARLRDVSVGRSNGTQVQITGGLLAGELVILHPGERVADGAKVVAR
jgi:HlyD family secretion protein